MKPRPPLEPYELGLVVGFILSALIFFATLVEYAGYVVERRATECSELLHKVSNDTLSPLTEDASVEIGACLLQFNQSLTGEIK